MNQPIIFIFIAIFILVLLSFYFFSEKARIKRKLKKAEYRIISKFKDNEIAKITGNVTLIEEALIAPLSRRKCVLYYIHVEQKVSSGKHTRWKTIIEEEVSSRFLINDDNHYAFINDINIKSYIVQDKSYSSGIFNDATENLEKYLSEKGYESEGFLGFNKTIRYKEGVLEIGEEIAVFGKGTWKDAEDLDLPKKYRKVLEITSNNDESVYISDDPSTTIKKVKKDKSLGVYRTDRDRYSR